MSAYPLGGNRLILLYGASHLTRLGKPFVFPFGRIHNLQILNIFHNDMEFKKQKTS